MSDALEIRPSDVRTGVPVTVTSHGPPDGPREAIVRPVGIAGAAPFRLPLDEAGPGRREGRFVVALAGTYAIEAGAHTTTLHIEPQRNLEFGVEFGIFSTAVLILLGGMLLWLRRRQP